MNKYKFTGMNFHFFYRILSGITKREYYYEIENFNIKNKFKNSGEKKKKKIMGGVKLTFLNNKLIKLRK